jgi:hypothetical protein
VQVQICGITDHGLWLISRLPALQTLHLHLSHNLEPASLRHLEGSALLRHLSVEMDYWRRGRQPEFAQNLLNLRQITHLSVGESLRAGNPLNKLARGLHLLQYCAVSFNFPKPQDIKRTKMLVKAMLAFVQRRPVQERILFGVSSESPRATKIQEQLRAALVKASRVQDRAQTAVRAQSIRVIPLEEARTARHPTRISSKFPISASPHL